LRRRPCRRLFSERRRGCASGAGAKRQKGAARVTPTDASLSGSLPAFQSGQSLTKHRSLPERDELLLSLLKALLATGLRSFDRLPTRLRTNSPSLACLSPTVRGAPDFPDLRRSCRRGPWENQPRPSGLPCQARLALAVETCWSRATPIGSRESACWDIWG
jgi:hypothetical protein